MKAPFLLAASVILCAHCAGSTPPSSVPAVSSASNATPTVVASTSASAPPSTRPDPLSGLRARGTIVGEPVEVSIGKKRGKLAFLGRDGIALAAWLVDDAGAAPVEAWPVGVKVREVIDTKLGAYAFVESVAALDQPAGKVGAFEVGNDVNSNLSNLSLDAAFAFRGVTDGASLRKAVEAREAHTGDAHDKARVAALAAAAKSLASLKSAISSEGIDSYGSIQGIFLTSSDHLDPKDIVGVRGEKLLATVKKVAAEAACRNFVCEAAGTPGIVLVPEGGTWKIRGLGAKTKAKVVQATPVKATTTPKVVDASSSTAISEAVVRRHLVEPAKILGEAPLGSGSGVIAVAAAKDQNVPWLVVADGAFERVLPLWSYGCCYEAKDGATTYELKFVDGNGDGRTDALFRRTVAAPDGKMSYTQLFVPPTAVAMTSAASDGDVDLGLFRAKTMDDAVKFVLERTPANVTVAEACAILPKAKTAKGFRAHAAPDAVVLTFEVPPMPTMLPTVLEPAALKDEDVAYAGNDCKELSCSVDNCSSFSPGGPGSQHYWFRRTPKGLLIVGMAHYTGT